MRLCYCSGGRAKCGGGPVAGLRALVWGALDMSLVDFSQT